MTQYSEGLFGQGQYGGEKADIQIPVDFNLPDILPLHDENTDFYHWIEAHRDEVRVFRRNIEIVQDSLQVGHASGQSLDLIGNDYGALAERRGRTDEEYRSFLSKLVDAFGGRGREKDVEFGVSAGLAIDESNVDVNSDFQNNEYSLTIQNWTEHTTGGTVERLADLTDPAAIPLVSVELQGDEGGMTPTAEDTSSTSLGYGLSTDDLGDLSSGEWNLSDPTP